MIYLSDICILWSWLHVFPPLWLTFVCVAVSMSGICFHLSCRVGLGLWKYACDHLLLKSRGLLHHRVGKFVQRHVSVEFNPLKHTPYAQDKNKVAKIKRLLFFDVCTSNPGLLWGIFLSFETKALLSHKPIVRFVSPCQFFFLNHKKAYSGSISLVW